MLRAGTLCSASQTPASAVLAQLTHTKTHTHKLEERKLFRSKFTSPAPTCFVVCCDCLQAHTHTTVQSHSFTSPKTKATKGKMPSLHYTHQSQTVTVTQVNHALVVDLNGSMCVIQHGFLTLLLTRVERGLNTAQLFTGAMGISF